MTFLKRDDILAASDIETEDVEVPEWGGTVRVKGMSGTERDEVENTSLTTGPDGKPRMDYANYRARVLVRCLIDEEGTPLFDRDKPADVIQLGSKSGKPIERLFRIASELSGLRADEIQELAGNSDAGPSDDSGSN